MFVICSVETDFLIIKMQKELMKNQINSLIGVRPALILLSALFFASSGLSQNIKTSKLIWQIDQVINLQNQTSSAYHAIFKTNADQSVEWIQKKGQLNTQYEVTGIEGNWVDLSTQGSITYLLSRNGKPVRMIMERNPSGIFITMYFSVQGQLTAQQKFHVQSVQPEN
jgi:hypothetical protein